MWSGVARFLCCPQITVRWESSKGDRVQGETYRSQYTNCCPKVQTWHAMVLPVQSGEHRAEVEETISEIREALSTANARKPLLSTMVSRYARSEAGRAGIVASLHHTSSGQTNEGQQNAQRKPRLQARERAIVRALLLPEEVVPDRLEELLTCAACARSLRPEDNDAVRADETLDEVGRMAPRQVCQYVFKRNDIVWICRTCQADETCVMCNECYADSQHEGHDVFFYHAQAGGCCDCGDADAWDPRGFCTKHGASRATADPLRGVPPDLVSQCSLVLDECVRAIILSCSEAVGAYTTPQIDEDDDSEASRAANDSYLALRACVSSSADDVDSETPAGENEDGQSPSSPRDDELVSLVLHHDDVHTLDEIMTPLQFLGLGRRESRSLALEAHESGEVVLRQGARRRMKLLANMIRARGVLVSVRSHRTLMWSETASIAIRWLHKLARKSDALCRLVCRRFDLDALRALLRADSRLPKVTAQALHALYLILMADQTFKRVIATAYANVYADISADYARGVGVADNSLFSLSVQFLNRATFVTDLVATHSLLETLAISLYRTLDSAVVESLSLRDDECRDEQDDNWTELAAKRRVVSMTHLVLLHRRYSPVIADLKCVLNIEGMSEQFVARCLGPFLCALSRVHGVDAQTRLSKDHPHVEWESRDWMFAFNANISISSVFDFMASWIRTAPVETTKTPLVESKSELIEKLFQSTILVLVRRLPLTTTSSPISYEEGRLFSGEPTLHTPLHRFFAHVAAEVVKSRNLDCVLSSIIDSLARLPRCVRAALVDEPLCALRLAAQIRVGLWRRNGHAMNDQLINYLEPPFGKMFRDLDLGFVQFVGLSLGAEDVVRQLLVRFDIDGPLLGADFRPSIRDDDDDKRRPRREDRLSPDEFEEYKVGLADEALHLLILLVTELPRAPDEDGLDECEDSRMQQQQYPPSTSAEGAPRQKFSARVATNVRRELVHRLASGPCTHSEIYECFQLIAKSDAMPAEVLESILESVSVKRAAKGLEPEKLQLKPECWAEFDPVFFHLSAQARQTALESMPAVSLDAAIPCIGPPPTVHPAFAQLRREFLTCDTTRTALDAALTGVSPEAKDETSQQLSAAAVWASDTLVTRALHILTLAAHTAPLEEFSSLVLTVGPQGRCLLDHIRRLHSSPTVRLDNRTRAGLSWLARHAENLGLVPVRDASITTDDAVSSCSERDTPKRKPKKNVEERKRRARERALAQMKRHSDAFAHVLSEVPENVTLAVGGGGGADDVATVVGAGENSASPIPEERIEMDVEQKTQHKRALGDDERLHAEYQDATEPFTNSPGRTGCPIENEEDECIVCRERRSPTRPLGFIAFAQRSCVFMSPENASSSTTSTISERETTGGTDENLAPVSPEPYLLTFPGLLPGSTQRGRQRRIRFRVQESSEASECRPSSIYIRQCGHAIHYDCFDEYFVTVVQRSVSTGHVVIDASAGEFQCPLCKVLSNTIVPSIPRRARRCNESTSESPFKTQRTVPSWPSSENTVESGFSEDDDSVVEDASIQCSSMSLHGVVYGFTKAKNDDEIPTVYDAGVMEIDTPASTPSPVRLSRGNDTTRAVDALVKWCKTGNLENFFRTPTISNTPWPQQMSSPTERKFLDAAVDRFSNSIGAIHRNIKPGAVAASLDAVAGALACTISAVSAERDCSDAGQLAKDVDRCGHLAGVLAYALSSSPHRSELRSSLRTVFVPPPRDQFDESYSMAVERDGLHRPNIEKPLLRCDLLALLCLVIASQPNGRDTRNVVMFVRLLAFIAAAQRAYLDLNGSASTETEKKETLVESLKRRAAAGEGEGLDANVVANFLRRAALLLDAFKSSSPWLRTASSSTGSWPGLPPPGHDASQEAWRKYFGVMPLEAMLASDGICNLVARWAKLADADASVSTDLYRLTRPELVPLPQAYTELHTDLTSKISSENPAVCLVCGDVMCAGGKGACTRHAVHCGAGVGIFFLLQDCKLLFVHGPRACYFASPYVDTYGERHGQFRGRPLFLDRGRIEMVRKLWVTHAIADHVVQTRSTSRQIIISGYY